MALKILLEEGNVSRAAKRLALTQPTVSGMLSRLRNLFDDPLFVRTQHGMLPTPRAEALAPALEQLLADASSLISPLEFEPAGLEMEVAISANDYMQSTVLIPLIAKLRKLAPRIRIAVRTAETSRLPDMLARGEIDIALSIPEFVGASLRTQHLYREEYDCIVRYSHPIKTTTVSAKQFLGYDHIVMSPASGSFHGPVDEALAEKGLSRGVALSVPGFHCLLEALQTDDLIALVPGRLVVELAGAVRRLRPPIAVPGFDVIAAWHGRTHYDSAHRWIREQLIETATELA